MVLQHIANSTGFLIKRPSPFDTNRLSSRDLDMVNVVAIPDRLKDAVAEAEDENILNGLLTEIVIDTKDLIFGQHIVNLVVELASRLKISAKRLLDDHTHPVLIARLRLRHAMLAQTTRDI